MLFICATHGLLTCDDRNDIMTLTYFDESSGISKGLETFQLHDCFCSKLAFILKINHKRHFIKIPFINKGMDFIDLPSIFQDKSVSSSIPDYFQNSEPPIICYKYNKPIRHTIFNFNKLVSDLDIHANTPSS